VSRVLVERVLGLEDRVGDKLACVLVGESVEDAGAVLAGGYQATEAHFREVLRDGGWGLLDDFGELVHAEFFVAEGEDDSYASGVREHRKYFHGELDVLAVGQAPARRLVCIHTQILAHGHVGRWGRVAAPPSLAPLQRLEQRIHGRDLRRLAGNDGLCQSQRVRVLARGEFFVGHVDGALVVLDHLLEE